MSDVAFSAITLDCSGIRRPDLGLIDQLARLRLLALRHGRELLLENANDALVGLIDLCGLADALRVEPGRKLKERKETLGVEEERDLGDLAR